MSAGTGVAGVSKLGAALAGEKKSAPGPVIAPDSFVGKVGPSGGRRNIRGLISNPMNPVQATGRGGNGQGGLRNSTASEKS